MKYEIVINDSVVTNDNLKDLWRAFFFFLKKKIFSSNGRRIPKKVLVKEITLSRRFLKKIILVAACHFH